jgi:ABC-2 type transport system ATP-binding protein
MSMAAVTSSSGALERPTEPYQAGIPVIFSSHQLELVEHLCDRVGIIQKGGLVASGTIDELRGRGPQQLWVDAPAAQQGWTGTLRGVRLVPSDGSRVPVELDASADDQVILRAALATGPVREFRRHLPSLFDIFREAMTESGRVGNADRCYGGTPTGVSGP